MRNGFIGLLFACAALALAAGCGGGANSTTPTTAPTGTAAPTYIPTGAPATAVPVGATSTTASVANGNFGVYIGFPVTTSGSGTMSVTASTAVPSVPTGIAAFSASGGTTLLYVVLTPSATVTFPTYLTPFQLTLPTGYAITPQGNNFFAAMYTNDPTFPGGSGAWTAQFLGAASANGQVMSFPAPSTPLTFTAGDYYVYALYTQPS
jgi:hypothetical protein